MMFSTKVNVKQGTVIGGEDLLPNGNPYHFFKGIPYAVPPLGELRFKDPVPLDKFHVTELECIKEGPASVQQDRVTGKVITGSEDCLYLNVFTPKSDATTPLPVMVYIHGGGFVTGNGDSDKHNPLYLLQEGVVVVTSNYRLGVLGFLSFPEADIPGNAGLKDQVVVMKWVKENISQFNGDPTNITLFGHSSGSVSVHMHLLSENSKKLFDKAIMQSGVYNMPNMVYNDAPAKTRNLAKSLGCTSDDPHEILKFLQNFNDLEEFVKPVISEDLKNTVPAKPVVEPISSSAVITKAPIEAMKQKNFVEIPILMGYTNAEGLSDIPKHGENLKNFHNDFSKYIPPDFNLSLNDPKTIELGNCIRDFYFKGEKIDDKMKYQLCDLASDFNFISSIREAAELHTMYQHKSPLYFYRFDFDGQLNLYKRKGKAEHLKGAAHVDELCYVFQMEFGPQEPWEKEAKKMVVTLCKMWANFAKYNNPTPKVDEECGNCIWEPVEKVDNEENLTMKTLIFDKEVRMLENQETERMTFWRNLKKKYRK